MTFRILTSRVQHVEKDERRGVIALCEDGHDDVVKPLAAHFSIHCGVSRGKVSKALGR